MGSKHTLSCLSPANKINNLNVSVLRDLMALDVMMKQQQELKSKIDGRSKTIQQCADLGKILIAAGNPASEEVRLTYELLPHTINTQ